MSWRKTVLILGLGTSDKLQWLAENGLLPLQPHQACHGKTLIHPVSEIQSFLVHSIQHSRLARDFFLFVCCSLGMEVLRSDGISRCQMHEDGRRQSFQTPAAPTRPMAPTS